MNRPVVTRRSVFKLAATAAVTGLAAGALPGALAAPAATAPYRIKNGRIRQSVVPWCFNPMTVPELARHSAAMGLQSVELCDPKFWPELKQLGLKPARGMHRDSPQAHR
jgi:hydroxypyruvate isomerase